MEKTYEWVGRYGPLLGRILMGVLFVWSGYGKLTNFPGTAGYMANAGIPLAEIALAVTILIELGGGLMLVAGWQARLAALAIFVFVIASTLVFHQYWAVEAAQRQMQMIQFYKNLAIMGGLLYVMAYGAGPLGLDSRRS